MGAGGTEVPWPAAPRELTFPAQQAIPCPRAPGAGRKSPPCAGGATPGRGRPLRLPHAGAAPLAASWFAKARCKVPRLPQERTAGTQSRRATDGHSASPRAAGAGLEMGCQINSEQRNRTWFLGVTIPPMRRAQPDR